MSTESKTSLTIVIPFIREGDEVEKTAASIRATATGTPDIILVNDGSADGYDYRSVAERYGCRYAAHNERRGVAFSRDHGVSLAKTNYILLLDAHMELYERGWDERLTALLKDNPRAVLFSQTQALTPERQKKSTPTVIGASINVKAGLSTYWNVVDSAPRSRLVEVDCMLGAAYAFSKSYYEHLHGLRGLLSFGADEQLLSLKVRCEGGRCLLVSNWVTGHIYRCGSPQPFECRYCDACYNRLLIAELFFESNVKDIIRAALQKEYGAIYGNALEMLRDNSDFVSAEKEYLHSIFDKKKLQELSSACERDVK
jgi:glycosyltransferase involved in cell wall biosynthesis